MFRSILHIIYTLIIVVGATINVDAQQGTSPVGVTITVTFDTPPTTYSVEQAPLKYNKNFALSMQVDDAHKSIFYTGLPFFMGDGTNPGLYYSDGCGNPHSFKMSSAVYIYDGNIENGEDKVVLDPNNGYTFQKLTWIQLDSLFKCDWGVLNHGVNASGNTGSDFMEYSINRNRSYIRRNLFDSASGGFFSHLFVNPGGSQPFSDASFELGYISSYRISSPFYSPFGEQGGDVNDTIWNQPYELNRPFTNDDVKGLVDDLNGLSVNGVNYWCPTFTHGISSGNGGDYPPSVFESDFTYIANTYGIPGLDNILMTTDEEIQDYLIVRDATDVNTSLNGTSLEITFTGNVPDDLLFYSSTILVNSDATINEISVTGEETYTDTIKNSTDALINVNWDGYYVIPLEVLGDSMVTIASGSQHEYDCWIAMDYVITMTNGSHKDSLREVLCSIPNVVYDDGFCNCEINLQPENITINIGESYTLVGPDGNYDYLWEDEIDSIGNQQTMPVTPTDTTTYYLTATNTYGCPSTDSIIVNVHSLNINIGNDHEICIGDTVIIYGPEDMAQYQWYINDVSDTTSQNIIVAPNITSTYRLDVTDQFGLSDQDTIEVVVNLRPSISIQNDFTAINYPECDTLFYSGPPDIDTLSWYENSVYLGSSDTTVIICPLDDSQYILIGVNSAGCEGKDTVNVDVNFLVLDLGLDTTICKGDSVLLEGPPDMMMYVWYENGNIISSDSTITPAPTVTTQYSLFVMDQYSNTDSDTIQINLWPIPTVDLGPTDTTIVLGDTYYLFGSNDAIAWEWYKDTIIFSNAKDTNDLPLETVQYRQVATNFDGCRAYDSILVNVHSYSFNLNQDNSVCIGNEITIDGPPDMALYNWYTVDSTIGPDSSITVIPDTLTKYFLQVTDTIGASAMDSVIIDVLPIPVDTIISSDTTIDLGECTQLLGPSGYSSYAWYIGDSLYSTFQDTLGCPTDTTTYTLIITDQNGCQGIDSMTVSIDFLVLDLGPDTTICEGECVYIEGPPDMVTYVWYEDGIYYSSNQSIEPCPMDTTQYSLLAIDQFGNTDRDTIQINVLPTPVVDLQPADTTIHLGDCVDLIGALGNYTWEWIVADTLYDTTQNISPCPLDTTTYNHIATNIYGCSGEDSIIVNIQFLYFDLGPDTTICEGNCVTLSGPPDMVMYNWIVADTIFDTVQTITPCPIDTTQYKLVVEDQYGNTAEDSITINVNPTPIVIFQPADTTIKEKACIELFGAVGNFTWEWIVADTLYDTIQNIFPCPEDTTWYKHIATNIYNCVGQDSIVVNIEFLSFDLGPDMTICSEDCVEIAGPDNMADYSWIVADTIFDTVQIIYPCPIEATQYKLVVFDSLGATAEDSIMINTIPKPTVTFENDSIEASFGSDIELSVLVSGDVDLFIWSYDGFDTITFSNNFLLKNVDISTYVYCSVTSSNQCTAIDSIYLTVLDCPEIITSNDTIICVGDSATLTVSGGKFFRWIADSDTISTDSVILVKPGITTLYIAQTAYELSSCYSSDTVIVMVYDSVLTNISYDTNIVCTNELIEVTASGADHYLWTPGGDTNALVSFTILDTTTMYLTGINNNGCHSMDSVTFYTKSAPSVSFTGLFSAFCENDPAVDLVGIPSGGSFTGNGIVGNRFIPAAAGSGVHEVYYSLTNAENCTGRDTVITTVYSSGGSINLGDDFTLQLNESKLLDAGAGFNNYYWTTGETTQTITVVGTAKPTGTYEYAVMGVIHGCSTRGSVNITFVNPDGYDEVHLPNLSIYPNPNLGKFTIKFSSVEKDISINITNIQGNDVYRDQKVSCDKDCKVEIDLVGVNSGFYFLQIATPTGLSTAKIIIK